MVRVRGFFIRLAGMKKKEKDIELKNNKKNINSWGKNRRYGM